MNGRTVKYPFAQGATFLWIGFVSAISFMEAWLKFSAPGITVPLGLGIGQLVFEALNLMEWMFAIVIFGNLLFIKKPRFSKRELLFLTAFSVLLLQTLWLLPALDQRAQIVIKGAVISQSFLHYYYVAGELIKVACLFVFGIKLYKNQMNI